LVDEKLVSKDELQKAEAAARQKNEHISSILIASGALTEEQLARFIGDKMHIPYVHIKNYTIDRSVLDLIPEKIARRYIIIPLFKIEEELTVAMCNPMDIIALDDIHAVARYKIDPVIASRESIITMIDQWYGSGDAKTELIDELAEELKDAAEEEIAQQSKYAEVRLKQEASDPPIVKLVNSFIAQAMLEGASDIHLTPFKRAMSVRFRIDGFLYNRHQLLGKLIAPITSRIKIMSGLDISKRRIPQDGRIGLTIRNKYIDIRTSTYPSMYGENVVLRLLDKSGGVPPMSELGFSRKDLTIFNKLTSTTKGILLATGPTGSGKTTTLYSTVNGLDRENMNIMTVEDPIEYEIEGVVQGQVDPKAGVNFAEAFRSILRQDPDIIYVGEIRDRETAEIAVRAALTGHLVLSTLHTNNAVGAIARLLDIGIEPRLIEPVLNGVFAQRLVRKICPRCKEKYLPDKSILESLELPSDTVLFRGTGCEHCNGIGYKGRIGIFEILVVNKDIRKLIVMKASEDEIMNTAKAQGMKTIFEDGLQKVLEGITTLEEVERVIIET